MPEELPHRLHLGEFVAHLSEGGSATTYALDDSFWANLGAGKLFTGGWLVSEHEFEGRWDHWEMHPRGEELVYLLGGSVDFTFDVSDRFETIRLESAGQYVIVPRGIWHIAEARRPSSLLTITAGDGTEHRPD